MAQPYPDVIREDHGSIQTFQLMSEDARAFVRDNVMVEGWQWVGEDAFAIEWRYGDVLAEEMEADGLNVRHEG